MAVINPNELSTADYWARVNGQAVPVAQPANDLTAIAGGRVNWNTALSPTLQNLAAGMAVQQNGYDATAAMPVAAGPAWAGAAPLPAYPQSGAHMTMPGSQEAWQGWGVPPVMVQRTPYATAAYRAYTDPYGQVGVQPLIGFSSEYPHVLSGVPGGLYRHIGEFAQALPYTPLMQMMAMGQFPPTASRPAATGGGNGGATRSAGNRAGRLFYGDTDTMPLPKAGATTQPQQTNAAAIQHPVGMYPGGVAPQPPVSANIQHPVGMYPGGAAPQQSDFTVDLPTVEEAMELADGMYVDPNKSVWENLVDAMAAVSIPLTLGLGSTYAAPRIAAGGIKPQTAFPPTGGGPALPPGSPAFPPAPPTAPLAPAPVRPPNGPTLLPPGEATVEIPIPTATRVGEPLFW